MKRAFRMFSVLTVLLCGLAQARADYTTPGTYEYTVLTTGTYQITAAGAQGGSGSDSNSIRGLGAVLSGDVSLTAGTHLQIVVGGQGLTGNFGDLFGGGGGGGSFVYISGPPSSPLLVAGGGGGAAYEGFDDITNGGPGQAGPAGQVGFGTSGGTGGTAGSGGAGGTNNTAGGNGGGGAGWLGNGGNGVGSGPNAGIGGSGDGGFGPSSFLGGLGDGNQSRPGGQYADGGFGGGGGGGFQGGGGGGGYSGGGGGDGGTNDGDDGGGGGGGGSYFASSFTNTIAIAGINSGDGYVLIAPLATAVPEPSSLLLLGIGGVSFALYGWRRRKQSVPGGA